MSDSHAANEAALYSGSLPHHVAIIMDGNGRWAQQRKKPRVFGHKAGVETVRTVVRMCAEKGITALTLFAFSTENWRRPRKEVELLLDLFLTALSREVSDLHKNRVCLRVIGDRLGFPAKLRKQIDAAEELTRDNASLTLTIAANYGGRWDVAQAAQRLAERIENGTLKAADITPDLLGGELSLSDLPEPDLFIRTGGEQRISNFLLWQLAYTELYFTETLWPEFHADAFEAALASFAARQRRFGRTGDQVTEIKGAAAQ